MLLILLFHERLGMQKYCIELCILHDKAFAVYDHYVYIIIIQI